MRGDATETGKMMYGKASFLLTWNGKGGGFFWQMNDTSSRPLEPRLDDHIGTPTAARYQVGVGWRRDYSGGTVLVNPSPTTAQTFNLGASYNTPSGTSVTTVTLQPTTAMILTGGRQRRRRRPRPTDAPPTTTTTTPTSPTTAPVNLSLPTIRVPRRRGRR